MTRNVKPNMPLVRRRDGWWITKIPLHDFSEAGPYASRKEANEDRRGLRRWFVEWARMQAKERKAA